MKLVTLLLIIVQFVNNATAQPLPAVMPKVGMPMPDFSLTNITHFETREASLKTFKGKWLFLDFWNTGCKACIASFPKINELHNAFKDKVTYMMVGENSFQTGGHNIETLYAKFQQKYNLQMPSAFDSLIFDRMKIGAVPHIFVIDPEGVLRYVTDGRDLTSEKVKDLLEGKQVSLFNVDGSAPAFNAYVLNRPYSNVLYHSTLTKWNGEKQLMPETVEVGLNTTKRPLTIKYAMTALAGLYGTAYLGLVPSMLMPMDSAYSLVSQTLFLDIKDSTPFLLDEKNAAQGVYNYSLTLPASFVSKSAVMKYMQEDLKRAFGYDVSVEKRDVPIWHLVAKPGAVKKLKTKGGEASVSGVEGSTTGSRRITNYTGLKMTNMSIADILKQLTGVLGYTVDKTGISQNIDLTIKADMTDIEDIRVALNQNGLDLVVGQKEMTAIVIKDPK